MTQSLMEIQDKMCPAASRLSLPPSLSLATELEDSVFDENTRQDVTCCFSVIVVPFSQSGQE